MKVLIGDHLKLIAPANGFRIFLRKDIGEKLLNGCDLFVFGALIDFVVGLNICFNLSRVMGNRWIQTRLDIGVKFKCFGSCCFSC